MGYFHEISRKIKGWGSYGQWNIEVWKNRSQSSSSLNTTLPKPKCQCSKLIGNCFLLNKFMKFVIIDQSLGYSTPLNQRRWNRSSLTKANQPLFIHRKSALSKRSKINTIRNGRKHINQRYQHTILKINGVHPDAIGKGGFWHYVYVWQSFSVAKTSIKHHLCQSFWMLHVLAPVELENLLLEEKRVFPIVYCQFVMNWQMYLSYSLAC